MASLPSESGQYRLCIFEYKITHERNNTVANTLLSAIVECGGVVVGSVVPDRNRVLNIANQPLIAA